VDCELGGPGEHVQLSSSSCQPLPVGTGNPLMNLPASLTPNGRSGKSVFYFLSKLTSYCQMILNLDILNVKV
jgi:hypothetical protein